MKATLLSELPRPLRVGLGSALFLDGRCAHPDARIEALTVEVGGSEQPTNSHGLSLPGTIAPGDYWWAMIDVAPVEQPTAVPIALRARLRGGGQAREEVGYLELDPGRLVPEPAGARGDGPLVAICMATHEPPREMLERQVESIRAQTHDNWICLISDDASSPAGIEEIRDVIAGDERFVLSPSSEPLGFYANFERALAMAPADAEYVALADQDDRWYPDKLEALLGALSAQPSAQLAYSDMRVAAPDGATIADTFWGHRRNEWRSLTSLLLANTVSGAASLFRREVLAYAWPFPPRHGEAFHDHWIALCAQVLGGIAYVDRPLYDYVQHGAAAHGYAAANRAALRRRDQDWRTRALERYRRLRARGFRPGWRGRYFDLYLRTALFARVLELRCGERMDRRHRRELRRIGRAERGVGAPAWLAARSVRSQVRGGDAVVRERMLLRGIAWRHMARAQARARRSRAARHPDRRAGLAPVRSPRQREQEREQAWLTPLLVDYFARDGSTLLMRLLATSPSVAVEAEYPYEAKYFAYLWRWSRLLDRAVQPVDGWEPRDLASLAQEHDSPLVGPPPWGPRRLFDANPTPISQALFEAAWREFSQRAAAANRERHGAPEADVRFYAEKHVNTWEVRLSELPPVKLVALLRDPRDVYVSMLSFDRLRGGEGFGQERAATAEAHLLEVIARQRRRLRWIASLLERDEVPVVRYETLVQDLPSVAATLSRWLSVRLDANAASDASVLRRHQTADSPQESIGRWKSELDPAIAARLTRELEPELRTLGFET